MKHQGTRRKGLPFQLESLEQRSLLSGAGVGLTTANNDVYFLYEGFLQRNPAPSELSFWSGNLQKGVSPQTVFNAFATSTEYKALVASGSINPATVPTSANWQAGAASINSLAPVSAKGLGASANVVSYVDALYSNLLNRSADTAGETYWVNQIQHGASLTSVVQQFLGSSEYQSIVTSGNGFYVLGSTASGDTTEDFNFVDTLYSGVLGRSADTSGEAFWVNQIQKGENPNTLITVFFTSPEYVNSFNTTPIVA
jgi:hypothetical protein